MDNNQEEKMITDLFMERTNGAIELKDTTWENINNELFSNKTIKYNNVKKRFVQIIIAASVIVIAMVSLSTNTGQAMINRLKEMFVEEKDDEIEIEGQKEQARVQLEANEELRYIIYVDESRYKLIKGKDSDIIIPSPELDDNYPEVSMEITYLKETTKVKTIQEIKKELIDSDMEIIREEEVEAPLEATLISAIKKEYMDEAGQTGSQWDTPIRNYYITNDREGQLFVIKEVYFLEAAEGHGARFYHMLESFEMIN